MSMFSFISFPRKVDKTCLKSIVDTSKLLTVKDLKGTEHESSYLGLPEKQRVYLGDSRDFDELRVFEKYSGFTFEKEFENEFVYEMQGLLGVYQPAFDAATEKLGLSMEEIFFYASLGREDLFSDHANPKRNNKFPEWEGIKKTLEESLLWGSIRCTKQLHDVIWHNTVPGEFVEIYSGVDRSKRVVFGKVVASKNAFTFGAPKEVVTLDAREVLTSPLLDVEDGLKVVIHNTG